MFGILAIFFLLAVAYIIASLFGSLVGVATKGKYRSAIYIRNTKRTTFSILLIFVTYQTYVAFYPEDDFYFNEYEITKFRKPPENAKIIAKTSTYPDIHGDYCSFSRIEFDRQNYQSLMGALEIDKRFSNDRSSFVSMGGKLKLSPVVAVRTFTRNDTKPTDTYSVSFLEGGTLVEVNICVT